MTLRALMRSSRPLAITALLLLALVAPLPAQDGCYADCADGLVPTVDLGPAAGDPAPLFRATLLDPNSGTAESHTLESLLDGRPLILAFGSYTWMGFRSQFESLVQFERRWNDAADVFMVYGKEAFPSESQWPAPVPDGRPVFDPRTAEDRLAVADRFLTEIGDQLPLLVDDLDDSMMKAFDAYPFRLYAITPGGRIAVESQKGASGFAPTLARIERWLGERSFASRGFSRE